jgi:hypothetical protein
MKDKSESRRRPHVFCEWDFEKVKKGGGRQVMMRERRGSNTEMNDVERVGNLQEAQENNRQYNSTK